MDAYLRMNTMCQHHSKHPPSLTSPIRGCGVSGFSFRSSPLFTNQSTLRRLHHAPGSREFRQSPCLRSSSGRLLRYRIVRVRLSHSWQHPPRIDLRACTDTTQVSVTSVLLVPPLPPVLNALPILGVAGGIVTQSAFKDNFGLTHASTSHVNAGQFPCFHIPAIIF
jgi:hypothetical protein